MKLQCFNAYVDDPSLGLGWRRLFAAEGKRWTYVYDMTRQTKRRYTVRRWRQCHPVPTTHDPQFVRDFIRAACKRKGRKPTRFEQAVMRLDGVRAGEV